MKLELPIKFFKSSKEWESWLSKHYSQQDGLWLKFYKKDSKVKTLVYAEALDVALCYGWIDTQAKALDAQAYLQKFTPRRKGSIWSKRNIEHVARLKKAGRMKPAGLAAVEVAKKSGAWERAYEGSSTMQMPKDFLKELKKNKQAQEFFATLNKANTYAIAWRIHQIKRPENRVKKIQEIINMLSKKQKFH